MLRVRGLRAQLPSPGIVFLRSGRVTLGDVRSRSNATDPGRVLSRPACPLTRSPFPRASLTLQQPQPGSHAGSPSGAQDACATAPPPPPRGSAAGASRWAPRPRALPGRGARLCSLLARWTAGIQGKRVNWVGVSALRGAEREGGQSRDSQAAPGMIHELLLALSGYPGSIFTWNKRSGLQVWRGPETRSCSSAGADEPRRRGGTRGDPD